MTNKKIVAKPGKKIVDAIKKQVREAPKSAWSNWSNHDKR